MSDLNSDFENDTRKIKNWFWNRLPSPIKKVFLIVFFAVSILSFFSTMITFFRCSHKTTSGDIDEHRYKANLRKFNLGYRIFRADSAKNIKQDLERSIEGFRVVWDDVKVEELSTHQIVISTPTIMTNQAGGIAFHGNYISFKRPVANNTLMKIANFGEYQLAAEVIEDKSYEIVFVIGLSDLELTRE